MKNVKLIKYWDVLRSSYWFLPGIMAIMAIILALIMLTVDNTNSLQVKTWWVYTGGADGARALLEAVASSMISVTATAFSITIVALQLAASNFGPRLLRNFMQDMGNQIVLGTFIGTYIYCLLILRTVHSSGDGYNVFVPHLSVTVGLILAIISIGVLIYFIHHASMIIQASNVIENVSEDLHKAIQRVFPSKLGHELSEQKIDTDYLEKVQTDFNNESRLIFTNRTGYLQVIDTEKLMEIAQEYDLIFRVEHQPGQYIIKGFTLVSVLPTNKVNHHIVKKVNNAFILGKERTEQQDIEFPINQLVEIALRAMSPAVNDPFTAIRCIDRLCAALCHTVQRSLPSPYRFDHDQKLRVIAETITFAELVDDSFNQIRQYGQSDAAIMIHLLNAITQIATYTQNHKYRATLKRHADMILEDSLQGLAQEQDRQDAESKYQELIKIIHSEHNSRNWN